MGEEVELEGDPFALSEAEQEARKLILEKDHITEGQKVKLVTLRVVRFTAESKVKPADYEGERGYAEVEPEDLYIHVPIYDPANLIGPEGDVGLFGRAFHAVATELDMRVVDVANRRADRQIIAADTSARTRPRRFEVKEARKEVSKPQETTVL
jgi:hypothetical protein